MKPILQCNEDRVMLAHSRLDRIRTVQWVLARLQARGGELKGKGKQNKWEHTDIKTKIVRLKELATRLQSIKNDLSTFKVELSGEGWMNVYASVIRPSQIPPEILNQYWTWRFREILHFGGIDNR